MTRKHAQNATLSLTTAVFQSGARAGITWCVAMTLCLSLASPSTSAAITIAYAPGVDYVESVAVDDCPEGWDGTVTLDPAAPIYRDLPPDTPAAGQSQFWPTYSADKAISYPTWSGVNNMALTGQVVISAYKAVGDPRNEEGDRLLGWGGAKMLATYIPGENDALPPGHELTFIQMFTSSSGAVHIDPFPNDPFDPNAPQLDAEPFYYTFGERRKWGLTFDDNPARPCPQEEITTWFRAETYLASFDPMQGAGPKTFYLHDGWEWGYHVDWAPEPASALLLVLGAMTTVVRRRVGV